VPDLMFRAGDKISLPETGKVYVLDGRGRTPAAMERVIERFQRQVGQAGLVVAPLEDLR